MNLVNLLCCSQKCFPRDVYKCAHKNGFPRDHRDLLSVNKKIDYPHIYSSVYMRIVDLSSDREQVPVP